MNESACPAPGAVGSVKHEHAASPAIVTNCPFHRLIFFYGGLGKLLTEFQNGLKLRRCSFDKLCHDFLSETVSFETVALEPLFHLLDGVWIVESRHILHGSRQLRAGAGVHFDGFLHQIHVETDTTVVDFLIDVVFIPDIIRHRKFGKPILDADFGLHIADVVFFEGFPLIRRMERAVPCSTAVCFRWSTGYGEVFDQVFALCELLFLKTEDSTYAFQGKRQSHCGRPNHRASPALRIQESGAVNRERVVVMEGVKAHSQITEISG